ncbi:MAG: UbiA family prenyltransferase [Candidatus Marsarchaeota archaeon]|nr:UbiA family prenyltransferase [Candidatus Marsarchaeota archaeon]
MRKPDVEKGRKKPFARAGPAPANPLRAWLKLVRIEHALMSVAGVMVGILLAAKAMPGVSLSPTEWLLALAVPFFINLASFALNDYFDVEADRKNKRMERPLVSGALKPSVAGGTAILGYLIGIGAGWLLNPICGIIAAIFAILSAAYNYKLKDWPLIGNAYIALSMAIAFPFGALALGVEMHNLPQPIVWLTIGAFLAGLARELVKSVQDMEGDRKARNSKHLPILIGARPTLALAGLLAIGFCLSLLMLAFSPGGPAWSFLPLALLAVAGLSYLANAIEMLGGVPKPAGLERLRKTTLYALGLALAAVALAVLI